ncbi:MAG: hypothetical protein RL757_1749 [Bacteroidota bacterium]|jgi:GH43 family beta-xylosidase
MYLISTEQGLDYVRRVREGNLDRDEWTHEVHLIVGLWHFIEFKSNALTEMRQTIRQFNQSVGTINSDQTGYHETMTFYWLLQLKQFCERINKFSFDETTIDELMFDESLVKRNSFLEFYSLDLMKSVEARRKVVSPDLKNLPDFDFFQP